MTSSVSVVQTKTPYHISRGPEKQALVDEFKGKPLNALRTPAVVIDRAAFAKNCARMHQHAKQWGADFRAHVKTHKTAEGTRLQLQSTAGRTHALVVSTIMEACEIFRAGLVADGTVTDILYGLPLAINKVADLSALRAQLHASGATIRILIDHPDQIDFLELFERQRDTSKAWSTFIKIDCGTKRAGLNPASPALESLLTKALSSAVIDVYGFYCHAGNAYAATSLSESSAFLSSEVEAVNTAAGLALSILAGSPRMRRLTESFVLSVGSTPTAHAATLETRRMLTATLNGRLELHAGNYPLLDLQQLHTGLIDGSQISQRVLATVISYYPGRGENGTDEAMCDAGAIAMSKDNGPMSGYGDVVGKPWKLGRISQEHGILTQIVPASSALFAKPNTDPTLRLGEVVEIIGQHACLTLAAYPWYYVVDSEMAGKDVVEDVWVPWKGW